MVYLQKETIFFSGLNYSFEVFNPASMGMKKTAVQYQQFFLL
jgi:hypothetical protein